MEIETAVLNELLEDTTFKSYVEQRIYYAGFTPKNLVTPYVVLQVISDFPVHAHDGFNDLSEARIQLNVYSTTHANAKAISSRIFVILENFHGEMGGAGGATVLKCLNNSNGDLYNENNLDVRGVYSDYEISYRE